MVQINSNLLDVPSNHSDLLARLQVSSLILINGMLNLKLTLRSSRILEDVWREASNGNQSGNHSAQTAAQRDGQFDLRLQNRGQEDERSRIRCRFHRL